MYETRVLTFSPEFSESCGKWNDVYPRKEWEQKASWGTMASRRAAHSQKRHKLTRLVNQLHVTELGKPGSSLRSWR
ncbi:hypothetical protein Cadr_000008876 [Camelus dromedarius]|uniref:Uncharacterized protein n=1 Tax=Camelus dromedarius TaxID=9838 RepID=A0A5N4DJD9_CAMDR|nr:hypothetical protein Cadr_000008876 [Camelus dromedarius]